MVLDASMALAWLFERELASEADLAEKALSLLLDAEAIVPPLWHAEVTNALLVGERRGIVTRVQSSDYLSRLSRLPIATDEVPPSQCRESVIMLAREHALSAHDAVYLELALRSGTALASFDQKLLSAAHKAGGRVFGS